MKSRATDLYKVSSTEGLSGYGDVLFNGALLTSYEIETSGLEVILQESEADWFVRSGPFFPRAMVPIAGTVIVDKDVAEKISKSGLTGATLEPVELRKCVRIDWLLWESDSAESPEDLFDCEENDPRAYLIYGPNDETLRKSAGEFFRLVFQPIEPFRGLPKLDFYDPARGLPFVSPRAATFLAECCGMDLEISPLTSVPPVLLPR